MRHATLLPLLLALSLTACVEAPAEPALPLTDAGSLPPAPPLTDAGSLPPAPQPDAALVGLTVSPGSLAFVPEQTAYEVQVPTGVSTVSLTAFVAEPATTSLFVNGVGATSGSPVVLSLSLGATTTVDVRVQGASGTSRVYTVSLSAQALLPTEWIRGGGSTDYDYGGSVSPLPAGGVAYSGLFRGAATFEERTFTSAGGNDFFVMSYAADGRQTQALRGGSSDWDYASANVALADGSVVVSGQFQGTLTLGSYTLTSAGSYDCYLARIEPSGAVRWAVRFGGVGHDGTMAVAKGPGDGLYVGGYLGADGTFGTTTLKVSGGLDGFVARYSVDGIPVWAMSATGPGNDAVTSLAVAPSGELYATGSFTQSLSLGDTRFFVPGSDTHSFLARLSSQGVVSWAKELKGGNTTARAVVVLADGSPLVTGFFGPTAQFGPTTLESEASSRDAFLLQYSAGGEFTWVRRFGGPAWEEGAALVALPDGDALVAGYFEDSMMVGDTRLTSAGGRDALVARVSKAGILSAPRRLGGTGWDEASAITYSSHDQAAYVAGYFGEVLNFGGQTLTAAGGSDAFLLRLNP